MISERNLVSKVIRFFNSDYDIYLEIPVYNRCIDAVLLYGKKIITIEFKLKNWKQAIRQIRTHQLASDYSYLCMPKIKISEKMEEVLKKLGIGLMIYDENKNALTVPIKPKISKVKINSVKSDLLGKLEKIREYEKLTNQKNNAIPLA